MPDENIDLEALDSEIERESKVEKRIKDLSEKARQAFESSNAEKAAREKAEAEKAEALRERDFYSGFADVVSTNPAAKDHKDDILAKVKNGYSVEDATFAVLGKAGKLGQPAQPKQEVANPVGGSAVTQHATGGEKPLSQLTREEKRAKVLEAVERGDISMG